MVTRLEDLDELVLRCRDHRSRDFIAEAVTSYRAGAVRSAIVATWIAVCFDIIEKIRELSISGDKEAVAQIETLENIRSMGDLKRALEFERGLLALAKDKFELISPIEYSDLLRLQEDRNRCAHPSLTIDEKPYSPPAELGRLHIHSAITHLLQHPPAQGKSALDRLLADVTSEYFPLDVSAAKVVLLGGPLKRPKDSLTANFLTILLKKILSGDLDYKIRLRFLSALQATAQLQRVTYEDTLERKLSMLFTSVSDDDLSLQTDFLEKVPQAWDFLDEAARERLRNFITMLPSIEFHNIGFFLSFAPLKNAAVKRVRSMKFDDLRSNIFLEAPAEVINVSIERLKRSHSQEDANGWAVELGYFASSFSESQTDAVLHASSQNPHVRNCQALPGLLKRLRSESTVSNTKFDAVIAKLTLPGSA